MADRTRLDWAQFMAAKGINTFIVTPQSKRPLEGQSWYLRQTAEPDVLAQWFEQTPECNYGVHLGAEYVVVDLDLKPDVNGVREFEKICAENGIEDFRLELDTLMVRTPSGGYHLYFKAPFPCANKNHFPTGIDVRGVIGYVVGPGSEDTRGEWSVIDPAAEIMELPEWLSEFVVEPGYKDPNHHIPLIELDLEENIQHAVAWLAEREASLAGKNGDDWGYETCQYLRDFGLSGGKAHEVLNMGWNQRSEPPWTFEELERVITNAYRYGQNRPGEKSPTYRAQRVFSAHGRGAVPLLTEEQKAELFHPKPTLAIDNTARLEWEDAQGIPSEVHTKPAVATDDGAERRPVFTWLSANSFYGSDFEPLAFLLGSSYFQINEVNVLDALPDTGKTMLLLHLAAAVASGRDLWDMPVKHMPVVMVLYEDNITVAQSRWRAILAELGVSEADAINLPVHTLYMDKSDPDARLAVINSDGSVEWLPFADALNAKLTEISEPAAVFLDTLFEAVPFIQVDKASTTAALKGVLRTIQRTHHATVVASRHPSKAAAKDESFQTGDPANQGDIRQGIYMKMITETEIEVGHYKFNGGRKSSFRLDRHNMILRKAVTAAERAKVGKMTELEVQVLDDIRSARANNLTVAVTSGHADRNAKRIAKRLSEAHGKRITTERVRTAFDSLADAGHIHYTATSGTGRNYKPKGIEIGPPPAPDWYDPEVLIQWFHKALRRCTTDTVRADHLAHLMVTEIEATRRDGETRPAPLPHNVEQDRIKHVVRWIKNTDDDDVTARTMRADDGLMIKVGDVEKE